MASTVEPQTQTETVSVQNQQSLAGRAAAESDKEDAGLLPKTRVVVGQDGVFANMSQKPQQDKPLVEEMHPPSYDDIDSDDEQNPPTYYDTSITCISEDGEVLIEGFPVGEFHSFIMNMFVSMAFDLLGFLITMLFSTCHASKFGSQVGLGFTMMRFGLEFKLKAEGRIPIDEPFNPNIDPEEVFNFFKNQDRKRREFSSFILIMFGAFISLKALLEYIRIRRMKVFFF
jgi:hypothetical protein